MIESIQIKNFKSVVDLSLELGTLNVLIGENGCGKSNILEALAFGAAASADKLDFEFLGSRGIRVTNSEFMFSAFSNGKKKQSVGIGFLADNKKYNFDLANDSNNSKKWIDISKEDVLKRIDKTVENFKDKLKTALSDVETKAKFLKLTGAEKIDVDKQISLEEILSIKSGAITHLFFHQEISNYIIYSPEQTSLRKFEDTTQIYPLGIKGEGLFQYLKEISSSRKQKKTVDEIKQILVLLDWYENFELPDNLMSNEFSLRIKDKYLYESLQYFDQRSTNEGFLFLLFYSTLFISKATPSFFAIDNIDASLNPKLCMQLIKNLASLAKKHKKQVIVTTHNPAVLDGLNLKDNNQRLFVVRRNDEGHTKAKRIEYKADRKMKMSELWTSGFIGGLPENF